MTALNEGKQNFKVSAKVFHKSCSLINVASYMMWLSVDLQGGVNCFCLSGL